jgi:hypothetical protein
MKIKSLFLYLFFITNITAQTQEYGILVKHTMRPFVGWDGSHGGIHYIDIGAKRARSLVNASDESVIEFDFFFVTDDPTEILCTGRTSGNIQNPDGSSNDCNKLESIPFNKANFIEAYFDGCIGDSEIMAIHLADTGDNQRCISQQISLNRGWNWQYSYDDITWTSFPAQYQENRTISFKINELNDYTGKNKIHFRTGYGTQFTKSIQYDIIGCSPELAINPPVTTPAKCKGVASGSVTLEFKTPLKDGDKFLFNIRSGNILTSKFVNKNEIENNKFTWTGLAEGNYTMKYQAQGINDLGNEVGLSAISTAPFAIGSPTQLTFTAPPTQPLCSTDKGSITITAEGGTPPYFYILDNETEIINSESVPKKHQFISPFTLTELSAGDHNIKVVDTNGCFEITK